MAKAATSNGNPGPAVRAIDQWLSSSGRMHQLLTDQERAHLAVIASIVRFKKGEVIYREGQSVDAIFNIINGIVTSYRKARSGDEHIAAFLFPGDLFGLSEEGRYTNSTRAITPVTAYRLPIPAIRSRLAKDATLEFHVICKLCHELRQAQRHAFLLTERRAVVKLAMFLQMLEQLQAARGEQTAEIHLSMNRSEIGEYAGMTLAAVSRAFHSLIARGVVKVRDRRNVSIVDRNAFDKIAGDAIGASAPSRPSA